MDLGPTFLRFSYCELEGKWRRISEEVHPEVEIYEAMEENAKINTRLANEKKNSYFLKKGAQISMRNGILKFNKEELAK